MRRHRPEDEGLNLAGCGVQYGLTGYIFSQRLLSLLSLHIWRHVIASVVWRSEFLAIDPEISGSILDAARFLIISGSGTGPLRFVRINEEENDINGRGNLLR
jgi:hypothetical protein